MASPNQQNRMGPKTARFGTAETPLVRKCQAAIVKETGLRRIRLHDLRHTQATLWLKSGEPTYIVSRRLGHVSEAFTHKQYAHVLPGQQRDAALRFAELIDHDSSPSVRHQNHA
jgi:integrase